MKTNRNRLLFASFYFSICLNRCLGWNILMCDGDGQRYVIKDNKFVYRLDDGRNMPIYMPNSLYYDGSDSAIEKFLLIPDDFDKDKLYVKPIREVVYGLPRTRRTTIVYPDEHYMKRFENGEIKKSNLEHLYREIQQRAPFDERTDEKLIVFLRSRRTIVPVAAINDGTASAYSLESQPSLGKWSSTTTRRPATTRSDTDYIRRTIVPVAAINDGSTYSIESQPSLEKWSSTTTRRPVTTSDTVNEANLQSKRVRFDTNHTDDDDKDDFRTSDMIDDCTDHYHRSEGLILPGDDDGNENLEKISSTANVASSTANMPSSTANMPSSTANVPSSTANMARPTANVVRSTANVPSSTANVSTANVASLISNNAKGKTTDDGSVSLSGPSSNNNQPAGMLLLGVIGRRRNAKRRANNNGNFFGSIRGGSTGVGLMNRGLGGLFFRIGRGPRYSRLSMLLRNIKSLLGI